VRRALPTARNTRVGVVILNLRQPGFLTAPAHQEVDLHVHQPRQQDLVAEIDQVTVDSVTGANNPVAVDLQDAGPTDFAGGRRRAARRP